MMLKSHSCNRKDFSSSWYRHWARQLKQDDQNRQNFALHSNKFWQNAAIAQALYERGVLQAGKRGVGFGVGQERLPALFAKLGVHIMATDQDFTTQKAAHWAKHELATSSQSLNSLGICPPDRFKENVAYMAADMKRIPAKLHGKYDFVWSNCALGHLGSLRLGLKFIEDSLQCLKPGGWAVHTTELNIVSDEGTVDTGDTVVFRLKDIYSLQAKLVREGYRVIPFRLTLGSSPEDKRISLAPEFGNDYSKLQLRGHVLTQVILMVQKPKRVWPGTMWAVREAYRSNVRRMKRYVQSDAVIQGIQAGKNQGVDAIRLRPVESNIRLKIQRGTSKNLKIAYDNDSAVPILGVYTELTALPIVLATARPVNRPSVFMAPSWLSNNRAAAKLHVQGQGVVEMVPPGTGLSFEITLQAPAKKGVYAESFCVVQEGAGVVEGSEFTVSLQVS